GHAFAEAGAATGDEDALVVKEIMLEHSCVLHGQGRCADDNRFLASLGMTNYMGSRTIELATAFVMTDGARARRPRDSRRDAGATIARARRYAFQLTGRRLLGSRSRRSEILGGC